MRRISLFSLIALGAMLLVGQPAAKAEMYTWTNPDGTLGVADDLSKVPEKYRSQAKKKGTGAGEGTGESGGVYYSKPQEHNPADAAHASTRQPEPQQEPLITMEEQKKKDEQAAEKRKKDEEEIKKTWERMKNALLGR